MAISKTFGRRFQIAFQKDLYSCQQCIPVSSHPPWHSSINMFKQWFASLTGRRWFTNRRSEEASPEGSPVIQQLQESQRSPWACSFVKRVAKNKYKTYPCVSWGLSQKCIIISNIDPSNIITENPCLTIKAYQLFRKDKYFLALADFFLRWLFM